MSNTTSGVPRIKELLSFSKNIKTPKMFIFLTEEYMSNGEMANRLASYVKFTTIGQLRKRIDIYYDSDPHVKGGIMEFDNVKNIFYGLSQAKSTCQTDISNLPWLMRIEFDREKMLNKEVTLLDIKSKFCHQWEKRYADIKSIKKEEKNLLDKILSCAVLSNNDNDKTPILHLRFDMNDYNIQTLVEFMDLFVDKFKIKGISNIDDISDVNKGTVLSYNNEDSVAEKKTNYVIYADGINLTDIRYLNGIDINKTFCNDIISTYDNFGIEATRAVLLKEFTTTFEHSGSSINCQHMELLVDIMTNNGDVTSIDRHGMNRIDNDPLSRASFEKTVDQLLAAAVFNKVDSMESVSSRIMTGLAFRGGTGYCNLILDTKMIEQSEHVEDGGQEFRKNYTEVTSNSVVEDIISKDEVGGIFMPD
jgi:DNA-directed RNA polymerase II subunit RPB1